MSPVEIACRERQEKGGALDERAEGSTIESAGGAWQQLHGMALEEVKKKAEELAEAEWENCLGRAIRGFPTGSSARHLPP
ncbi:MAG: hypothetical protein LAN62_00830 [Acidobacteriia bacterium]|nr:hypothetical protein [Terriglobia bacterium]